MRQRMVIVAVDLLSNKISCVKSKARGCTSSLKGLILKSLAMDIGKTAVPVVLLSYLKVKTKSSRRFNNYKLVIKF